MLRAVLNATLPPVRTQPTALRFFTALGVAVVTVVVTAVVVPLVSAGSDARAATTTTTTTTTPADSTTAPAHPGTDGVLPFSTTSFWNTPVAKDATLAPNSRALVKAFNKQWKTNYGSVTISNDDFSIPVYTVPEGQPTVAVTVGAGCPTPFDASLTEQLSAVPIPPDARPARGSDHTLVIWQPATNTEWELWVAKHATDGTWTSCWGGRITDVSEAQGSFPFPYGVAASGLAYLGGSMKVSELQAGAIKHALSVGVVETTAATQVGPATRNDGNSYSANAIPEGTRFRLDPSIDVTKLGLEPAGVVIARALQRYGMIVTDTSGAVALQAESARSYVAAGQKNPYPAIFGKQKVYEVLTKIPWNRLQVVAPES